MTIRHGTDVKEYLSKPIFGAGHSFTASCDETSMASTFANITMETVVNRNDYFDQRNDPLTASIVYDSGYQGLPCSRHLPNRGGKALHDEFDVSENQDNSNYKLFYPNPSDEQTSDVSELVSILEINDELAPV